MTYRVIQQFEGGSQSAIFLVEGDGPSPRIRKMGRGIAAQKLKQQARWLESMSDERVPKVYKMFERDESVYLDLEYFGEHQRLSDFEKPTELNLLKEHVDSIFDFCLEGLRKIDRKPDWELYIFEKVIKKMKLCQQMLPGLDWLGEPIVINGARMEGLEGWLSVLNGFEADQASQIRPQLDIHGDLTFENILVTAQGCKIIDPNPDNPVSNLSVELAKLLQSAHSQYEKLGGVKFLKVKASEFKIDWPESTLLEQVENHIVSQCESRFGSDFVDEMYVHEAIHFARLLPYKVSQRTKNAEVYALKLYDLMNKLRLRILR